MLATRFRTAVEEGSADQVPELFHEDAVFRIVPDVGQSGNVAAFCAALDP